MVIAGVFHFPGTPVPDVVPCDAPCVALLTIFDVSEFFFLVVLMYTYISALCSVLLMFVDLYLWTLV